MIKHFRRDYLLVPFLSWFLYDPQSNVIIRHFSSYWEFSLYSKHPSLLYFKIIHPSCYFYYEVLTMFENKFYFSSSGVSKFFRREQWQGTNYSTLRQGYLRSMTSTALIACTVHYFSVRNGSFRFKVNIVAPYSSSPFPPCVLSSNWIWQSDIVLN